ncbi:hypothetical protein CR513_19370, partial [Mucuna pruriens]
MEMNLHGYYSPKPPQTPWIPLNLELHSAARCRIPALIPIDMPSDHELSLASKNFQEPRRMQEIAEKQIRKKGKRWIREDFEILILVGKEHNLCRIVAKQRTSWPIKKSPSPREATSAKSTSSQTGRLYSPTVQRGAKRPNQLVAQVQRHISRIQLSCHVTLGETCSARKIIRRYTTQGIHSCIYRVLVHVLGALNFRPNSIFTNTPLALASTINDGAWCLAASLSIEEVQSDSVASVQNRVSPTLLLMSLRLVEIVSDPSLLRSDRINLCREQFCGIRQHNGETLHEYWERFNKQCTTCPYHQINKQLLIQYFYEGLMLIDKSMMDLGSGGALMDKTLATTTNLLSNMTSNTQQLSVREELCTHKRKKLKGDMEMGKNVSALIKNEQVFALIQPAMPKK